MTSKEITEAKRLEIARAAALADDAAGRREEQERSKAIQDSIYQRRHSDRKRNEVMMLAGMIASSYSTLELQNLYNENIVSNKAIQLHAAIEAKLKRETLDMQ